MLAKELNVLTAHLSDLCAANTIAERWLLAPSRRVGFQWLDSVARSGRPVLNVRVKTFRTMALGLADPEMEGLGATFLRGIRSEVLIGNIFKSMKAEGRGYLTDLELSPGLTESLMNTVRDLRLSGLKAAELKPDDFEVQSKGLEIGALLAAYEAQLKAGKLNDYADVLRTAANRLKQDPSLLPENLLALMPEEMQNTMAGLERALWEAIPVQSRVILGPDGMEEPVADIPTDARLLRFVNAPGESPEPCHDGTAEIFRAVGEVNEVREVLRRCLAGKIPLDEVEILHTDAGTYVPLIYELAWKLKPEDMESIPVTFAEGIPVRYSRPGRALAAWLNWIKDDYIQFTLVRMIQDGLLHRGKHAEKDHSFAGLAALFRSVPIGAGEGRYLVAIDGQIRALEQARLSRRPEEHDDGLKTDRRDSRIDRLHIIRKIVEDLLKYSPRPEDRQKVVLESALWFLGSMARCVNQFDEYSREILQKDIQELSECLDENVDTSGLNVWDWLSDLPHAATVGGQGPRPGCLYVASVHSGGHSGRGHTVIVGMDDARFPGAGLQDPLLLDSERGQISGDLPTAATRLARKTKDFCRLLQRIRGNITLSFCCRSLSDDREMFPSSLVLSAYRVLSGNHEGDQDDLNEWLPDRASFSPSIAERSIDSTEWWLWRTCGNETVSDPLQAISESFPHLGRGFRARLARASEDFTEYDGHVPEAGQDFDPTKSGGPVLSASALELLGSCPMEYFFRYILQIAPPEEYEIDPSVWLDPLEKGTLLHSVFREFMSRLQSSELLPDFDRDLGILNELLDIETAKYKTESPPPSDEVFESAVRELRRTVRIFLREEASFCRTSSPRYFEASIGMSSEGQGTPLDTPHPLEISLPDGTTMRARGRIDRIDEAPHSRRKLFTIWDYKTGSAWGYDRGKPFRQGRRVQSYLYYVLAKTRLSELISPVADIKSFGYFFPGTREHGERISWSADLLSAGGIVIEHLCHMIASGCFPMTDDPRDVRFSDYRSAFGDIEFAAEAIKWKLNNRANEALSPFRQLREFDQDSV